jgi:hypothetical protein
LPWIGGVIVWERLFLGEVGRTGITTVLLRLAIGSCALC